MRNRDIKIGKEYLVRGLRAEVLAKSQPRADCNDALKVRYETGRTELVSPREVACTWADYERRVEAARRTKAFEDEMNAQMAALRNRAAEQLRSLGVPARVAEFAHIYVNVEPYIDIQLSPDALERLLALLQTADPDAVTESDDDLLAALFSDPS